MKRHILIYTSFYLFFLTLLSPWEALAQCPTSLKVTKTDVTCRGAKDGTITVTVNDGTGPFDYALFLYTGVGGATPIFDANFLVSADGRTITYSGLAPTASGRSYIITVTQDNCDEIYTFPFVRINEPTAALALTVTSQTNVTGCFGEATGSVTVNATGGNASYEYSIDGGAFGTAATFSNLVAGTHIITVKDGKNCQAQQTITITQPPLLQITSLNQVNPTCNGSTDGSIAVKVSGGTGSFTFNINGMPATPLVMGSDYIFSNQSAGTKSIKVTDANGCTTTLSPSVTLTEPAVLQAAIATQNDANCFGETMAQLP